MNVTQRERKIVHIDEDKCDGCGVCVASCHEGALQIVDGKAKLVSDSYCDGLGDCLAPCPTGALSLITRPAEDYDEVAVQRRQAGEDGQHSGCPGSAARTLKPAVAGPPAEVLPCGCPGSMSRTLKMEAPASESCACAGGEADGVSELMNWPVQLRLVPPGAPYLQGADILLAADCTAVAVPDFHRRYLRNRPVLIACPKLEDNGPQIAKLAEIIRTARPAALTVLRMQVPCCGGLVKVAQEAVAESGIDVPIRVIVVGSDGAEISDSKN